ncbi:MAG: hypothetical protein AMJ53_08875 [Gammaproteobacteria bacterium SG8_11]|nr:MAG: hypothetical protein AMJ53_08875 [Gammaproteobacteria bacterium SG8_11]
MNANGSHRKNLLGSLNNVIKDRIRLTQIHSPINPDIKKNIQHNKPNEISTSALRGGGASYTYNCIHKAAGTNKIKHIKAAMLTVSAWAVKGFISQPWKFLV